MLHILGMARPKNNAKMKALNTISFLLVVAAGLAAFLRFGPPEIRYQANSLRIYAAGGSRGCSLSAVINSLDLDLYRAGVQLSDSVREVSTEGGLVLWDTPGGDIWAPVGNDVLFLLAEQAVDVYGDDYSGVQEGDIVLDLGANIGTFSRKAFNDGAAMVIAVEPSPLNVEALRRNFAKEIDEGRFVLVPKAVWNEPGNMTLQVFENSALDSLVMNDREEGANASEVEVQLVTIDSIVEELALERLDFLKMDIEGAEREAIAGAKETLSHFKPALAIATENLLDDVDVLPQLILTTVPDYTAVTGRCRVIREGVIRPEVIYFSPLTVATASQAR